jgi:hypothetical protein
MTNPSDRTAHLVVHLPLEKLSRECHQLSASTVSHEFPIFCQASRVDMRFIVRKSRLQKDFLSVRPIDYIVDFKGERSGFPTTMASWTVGVTHRFNDLISVRPEVRYEYAFSARPWDNGTRQGS